MRAGSVGTAQGVISKDDLESIELLLPPLPEQRRIVTKIDSLSAKSRRAREHLDHIPRLVEKYRQAVLASAFSSLNNPAILKPLGEIASLITSGSRDWAQYYDRGSSVFVLAGNVRPLAFDPTPKQMVDPPLDGRMPDDPSGRTICLSPSWGLGLVSFVAYPRNIATTSFVRVSL
jgi:type I restriction enzyme S subunit